MTAAIFSNGHIEQILATYGYLAVFGFVAIESLGIPFPGETILIAAALYAGTGHHLNIVLVIVAAAAGAIIGDNAGFALGRWGGYRLLRRYGSKIRLDEAKLKVGRYVFMRHGGKVVFFGRFVSVLRTYAAFLAGTNRMSWWHFLAFNASGGIIWATIYGVAYYELGSGLQSLGAKIDIGIGVAAGVLVLAFLVWVKRKEGELEERAERALPGPLAERMRELEADEPTVSERRAAIADDGDQRDKSGSPSGRG